MASNSRLSSQPSAGTSELMQRLKDRLRAELQKENHYFQDSDQKSLAEFALTMDGCWFRDAFQIVLPLPRMSTSQLGSLQSFGKKLTETMAYFEPKLEAVRKNADAFPGAFINEKEAQDAFLFYFFIVPRVHWLWASIYHDEAPPVNLEGEADSQSQRAQEPDREIAAYNQTKSALFRFTTRTNLPEQPQPREFLRTLPPTAEQNITRVITDLAPLCQQLALALPKVGGILKRPGEFHEEDAAFVVHFGNQILPLLYNIALRLPQ